MTARLHITPEPLATLRHVEQGKGPWGVVGPKPSGLWYGIGTAWVEWCRDNQPEWLHPHTYALTLTVPLVRLADPVPAGGGVLLLPTDSEILEFGDAFRPAEPRHPGLRVDIDIDWRRVAAAGYAGIEIAPYSWALRLDHRTHWYYGWDCASGCLWEPVATVVERRRQKAKAGSS